jgi:hypothetical protein
MAGRHGAAPCSAPNAFGAASLQCLQPERDTKADPAPRDAVPIPNRDEVLADSGISRRAK